MGSIDVEDTGIVKGRITVATHTWKEAYRYLPDAEVLKLLGEPDEVSENDNILCVNGLTVLVQGINWSGIVDQNANMGNLFSPYVMAPIYGAVGTSALNNAGGGTMSSADTALTTEVARSVVSSGGSSGASASTNASFSWLFLIPAPVAGIVIAEAGVYLQAQSALGTPNAPNGSLLDHSLISPTVSQSTVQLVTLGLTVTIGN